MASDTNCEVQDWCAVTSTSQIISRKWPTFIVHHFLRRNPQGFGDLLHDIESLSTKVLSESLEDLLASSIVLRSVVNDQPIRVESSLNEAIETWGRKHLADSASTPLEIAGQLA